MAERPRPSVRAGLALLYAVLVGVVGAGIVHVAILLLLPVLSQRDAWSRLGTGENFYAFVRLDGAGRKPPLLTPDDPLFKAAACQFDLGDGSVHVHAGGHVPFWSMSVYNRKGQNIYSLTDRTATESELDLVIATPAQMAGLRKDMPEDFKKSVFVEADIGEGVVVVRALSPDASWDGIVSDYIRSMICEPS